jgi:hypothetical protein
MTMMWLILAAHNRQPSMTMPHVDDPFCAGGGNRFEEMPGTLFGKADRE